MRKRRGGSKKDMEKNKEEEMSKTGLTLKQATGNVHLSLDGPR